MSLQPGTTNMRAAYTAATLSPDPSTQNGAVILQGPRGIPVAYGWNTPTPGVPYNPHHMPRDERLVVTEHAERDAIFMAARYGTPLKGATMVCPWAACAECARAIVLSGITTLVRHRDAMERDRGDWAHSIAQGDAILAAGGVEVQEYVGVVGGDILIRHRGEVWAP